MSQFYEYYWPIESTEEIALDQTPVSGKNLVLNGSYANNVTGTVSLIARGFIRKISLVFTGNFTGVTFTVNGTQNGVPIADIVNGTNNGNASTTEYFDFVTSISVSGVIPVGGTVAGSTDSTDGYFPLILLNTEKRISNMAYALSLILNGDSTCNIYATLANSISNGQTYTQMIADETAFIVENGADITESAQFQFVDVLKTLFVKVTPDDPDVSTLRMQFLQL